ncbi:hydroxymethylglutaryl-CoA lyase [Terriglobus albidus]|uniref:hydroxymethylglutaryl-CoA lyase n=1 Tax=Terriglobus albidus TaxID=1592106 RepID=UPI0021E0A4A6|nr:hydroxymethylglutaryl-CoA lyase [Terriglobus albidus]
MTNTVKLIECPRDAWQGLSRVIPAEVKADYLRMLIAAGFRHIDAASFVSPKAVPQMADSEKVLAFVDPPGDVEIIGIVVNAKGAERAIKTEVVTTLGFPYSISPEFLRRNQNQTAEQALDELEAIGEMAYKAGLNIVAYVSMAFGNPYGDPWSIDEVNAACELLIESGVRQISIADTVGLASAEQIGEVFSAARESVDSEIEIGLHLHAKPGDAAAKIRAAYLAGCRRFDTAIGGLGGCPFAQDDLVGNMPTEIVMAELAGMGVPPPEIGPLETLIALNREFARRYGQVETQRMTP